MKKPESKKINKLIILSGIIAVLTFVIAMGFIYKPFSDKNRAIRENILLERDKNLLIGRIRALGKHLKAYEKRIPRGAGVSWLVAEVSDMASKEQLEVSSITPGSPEDYRVYTKVYVTMEVISAYHQLGRFISRVESSEKFLRIESIGMKRLDQDEAFEKKSGKFKAFDVKASIVVSTIVMKE
ncbi:MAG: type 4a pilus biogenesis protein PilO [Candidatus Omnitrophota bacterium]